MDTAEALAVVVRGIRRGQGLSQEDINSLGRSYFSRIERGEVSIGLDVLVTARRDPRSRPGYASTNGDLRAKSRVIQRRTKTYLEATGKNQKDRHRS